MRKSCTWTSPPASPRSARSSACRPYLASRLPDSSTTTRDNTLSSAGSPTQGREPRIRRTLCLVRKRRGDGEKSGDGQDDGYAGDPAEWCDYKSGSIGQRSHAVLSRNRLRLLIRDVFSEHATPGGGVPPETVPHDRQQEERSRIQGGRHIRIRLLDVTRDQGCVEHGEDDEEQEHAVHEHESAVDLPDVVEHVVMVHPHDQDADETRHKGEERGPLVDEALRQRNPTRGRIAEVQREQRDSERKDAIAERLHPRGFLLFESFAVHDAPWSSEARIGSI